MVSKTTSLHCADAGLCKNPESEPFRLTVVQYVLHTDQNDMVSYMDSDQLYIT